MKDNFIRVACVTPELNIANCEFNTDRILKLIEKANENDCSLIVFPELSITSYSCGDLFFHNILLSNSEKSIIRLCESSKDLDSVIIVGTPVLYKANILNCACVIYQGKILGLVPKSYMPNYCEFFEQRYFTSGPKYESTTYAGQETVIGSNIIFACSNMPFLKVGIEICEDLWSAIPPSSHLALSGATVIANLSASSETIGKKRIRKELVNNQSSKTISAYLYACAGADESSSDVVFASHNIISENGVILKESERFATESITYADIDLELLINERKKINTFVENDKMNYVWFELPTKKLNIDREYNKYPYISSNEPDVEEDLKDALEIQSTALATRLKHINCNKAVIGISGGLDSTLALAVTALAFDKLNIDHENIFTVIMPGFGSSSTTQSNALKLAKQYKTTTTEINISDAVKLHLNDINHDINKEDVTYENSQARERTQILMDMANKENAIVIGTGDLSEIALGFSTYNGDHMSMYNPNSGVPKTLIRFLIKYIAKNSDEELKAILNDIINTPVSPELLPTKNGKIAQRTEDILGPYELTDFFLYYFVKYSFSPSKIFRISCSAFKNIYSSEEIKERLRNFLKRFFKSQFKRTCSPDGPKVIDMSLAAKTDFRMVSDLNGESWIESI